MVKALNTRIPNPGSKEAVETGCTCPVIDNHYGRGCYADGKTFIYNTDCEIHSSEMWIDENGLHID